jgi:hypothetical protein
VFELKYLAGGLLKLQQAENQPHFSKEPFVITAFPNGSILLNSFLPRFGCSIQLVSSETYLSTLL